MSSAVEIEQGFTVEPPAGRVRLMHISQAADLWLGELARQGRTPRTLASYQRTLNKLADTYPHHDVEELTATMVRRFLDGYQFNRKKKGRVPNRPSTLGQTVSILRCFFKWLHEEELISRNPAERVKRPRIQPAWENDNVTTVTSEDIRLLLSTAAEMGWPERIAVNLAVYSGARRQALATVRLRDFDALATEPTLKFQEKGGKTAIKPVAEPLADLLRAAISAGVYEGADDYLIPSLAKQRRPGVRDPRIVSRLVARVADRARVKTHVHSLRAGFAVGYLEQLGDGNLFALKELMGHSRVETTMIYLRRKDRRQSMETVRGMNWGLESTETLEANRLTEKEGFEPSMGAKSHSDRDGIRSTSQRHES